jgi:hypothetical protein
MGNGLTSEGVFTPCDPLPLVAEVSLDVVVLGVGGLVVGSGTRRISAASPGDEYVVFGV